VRRLAVVVVVFAAAALSARAAGPLILPTIPGAYNAAVKQTTIHKTVCITGWTRTIRPPLSYTAALKKKQVVALGYANRDLRAYEEDHEIPLSLGGSPRDPRNLWPQPWPQARLDDNLELSLRYRLCKGEISLRYARRFVLDWKKKHG
jgi:hypothetical protein